MSDVMQAPPEPRPNQCSWAPRGPDDMTRCANEGVGGVRLTLFASKTIQKRYGRKSMLSLILDMPICASCWSGVTIQTCTDQPLRAMLSRAAQRMNSGILVDFNESVFEPVAFDHPEYVLLRQTSEKQRKAADGRVSEERDASGVQPVPAAPQPEGAGEHGTRVTEGE